MNCSELLNLLWRSGHLTGRIFSAATGEIVEVAGEGECDDGSGVWFGVDVTVDGERRRGTVAVGENVETPADAILRVTAGYALPIQGLDDATIPHIEYGIEPEIAEVYGTLRAGAGHCGCAAKIAGLSSLHRTELYTKLLVDRLRRKTGEVEELFRAVNKDWNQAFHVMLFRAMGGNRNREVFMELASRVTATMVSREKGSQARVEALLLGGAGFLQQISAPDEYTLHLAAEFRHLAAKYSIIPLTPAEWELNRHYLANYPAVRLAELAVLLSKKEFMLDRMLACRTSADVEALFAAEASEYWTTRHKPGETSKSSPKRIGRDKARLVGINLVAPLMFAYGRETGSEELCGSALDLLSTIPAEKNSKLDVWYGAGCVAGSGFESQALLQLADEYCSKKACARCHIGRGEIKKIISQNAYKWKI